jgi:hypothetical protein
MVPRPLFGVLAPANDDDAQKYGCHNCANQANGSRVHRLFLLPRPDPLVREELRVFLIGRSRQKLQSESHTIHQREEILENVDHYRSNSDDK